MAKLNETINISQLKNTPSVRDYAKIYAKIGFKPFPLLENSKVPATRNGFKDATNNPALIDFLFANHNGNIGLNFPPELFAIDLDVKNGKDGVSAFLEIAERNGGIPDTLIQLTPSGGKHYIFRKPAEIYIPNTSNILADGIDTRTNLGYIVAEPSLIDHKSYNLLDCSLFDGDEPEIAIAPDWLLDMLGNWKKKPIPSITAQNLVSGGKIMEGGRNDSLTKLAGAMRRYGCDELTLLNALNSHNSNNCFPPLPVQDIQKIAKSISRYDPAVQENLPEVKKGEYFTTADELRKSKVFIKWLVKGWIPRNSMIMLHGPSGSGKSLVVMDMVCRVASDHLDVWNGHKVRHGGVVYLAGEGYTGMNARLEAWCQHHEINTINMIISNHGTDLNTSEGYNFIVDEIKQMGFNPDLIVIDTLHRFLLGDENSAQDAGSMIKYCGKLMNEFDCSCMYIHHTGVAEGAQNRARGSSAWKGALESEINIIPQKDDSPMEVKCLKTKDGTMPETIYMRIKGHQFDDWLDEDDEPISGAIVVQSEQTFKEPAIESNYKKHFCDALKSSGKKLENGKYWISEDDWASFCVDENGKKTPSKRSFRSQMKKYLLLNTLIEALSEGYCANFPVILL